MLANTAAKVPCKKFFPNTVETFEGWVTINPHIKPSATPQNMSLMDNSINHESLSHGGIYTDQELAAWESQLQFSNFHHAVTKSVSYGVCIAEDRCVEQMYVPSYDLKNLVKEEIEQVNVIGRINNWIKSYSGLIGVIVIMGWTIKMVVYITIITATIIKKGISSTVALVYATCCFVPYTAGSIRWNQWK